MIILISAIWLTVAGIFGLITGVTKPKDGWINLILGAIELTLSILLYMHFAKMP